MNAQTIEKLKSEGRFRHAGALAFILGHDDHYGCHFGFRSERQQAVSEFRQGHAEAKRAMEDSEPEEPDDRLLSQCDCCGEMKPDCEDVVAYGMDTHACAKCRSIAEDDDPAADRGDWECHQMRDE